MSISDVNEKYPVYLVHMVEDDQRFVNMAKAVLKNAGLKHVREFGSPEQYQKWLEDNPQQTVHIAILDFRFESGLDGNDLARELYLRCLRKRIKTKVIMLTAYDDRLAMAEFIDLKGHAWVFKNRTDTDAKFKAAIQTAVAEIRDAYEDMVVLKELKEEMTLEKETVQQKNGSNGPH